jgi:uncharacterized protein (UPF0276 family)
MPPLPDAGLGLKAQHWAQAAAAPADGVWFEVHAENYLCAGGPRLRALEAIRRDKPISLHGVGLSLAADAPPDPDHMAALRRLAERIEPFVVSEHLAWSSWGGVYRPDLLPFPRTREALNRVAANVARLQDVLGRQVLIENPSLYLPLRGHDLSEADFLTALARRTGCGLLVDVNNAHVSGVNLGFDPGDYLDALPAEAIGEVHLAGHTPDAREGETLLIDSHAAPVAESVWALFARLIGRIGPRPTLIERDDDIPPFGDLMVERARAAAVLREAASPRDLERAHG